VSTPPEVEVPGAAQRSGQPAAEEDHRVERRPAWPTGEAARHRPPRPPGTSPHLNGVGPGVEVEGPRGVAVVAMRGGGVTAVATMLAAIMGSAVAVPPS
jgi:hypothetical protein